MPVQVRRSLRHAIFLEILGRRIDVIVHSYQVALHQVRLAGRPQADGDVGLAHGKVQFPIVQNKADLDFRIEVHELLDSWRQPDGAEGDRRGDPKRPLRAFAGVSDPSLGRGQLGEHLVRGEEQFFALFGQLQAAGVTVEQLYLKAFFQG